MRTSLRCAGGRAAPATVRPVGTERDGGRADLSPGSSTSPVTVWWIEYGISHMKRVILSPLALATTLATSGPATALHPPPPLCPGRVIFEVLAEDVSGEAIRFIVRGPLVEVPGQGLTLQRGRCRCIGTLCPGRRGGSVDIFGAKTFEGGAKFRNRAICGWSSTAAASSYTCWDALGQVVTQGSFHLTVLKAPPC